MKKEIELIEALIKVVSDCDLLDTHDVEYFYRNQDRIINGDTIDKAWEALKLKGKVKEVHNNALKMVEEGLEKERQTTIMYKGEQKAHKKFKTNQGFNECRSQIINNINKLKL